MVGMTMLTSGSGSGELPRMRLCPDRRDRADLPAATRPAPGARRRRAVPASTA